jgi:hypothetical protein
MTDIGQQNLREPEKVDWDTAFSGSKYMPPPPAIGPDGKPIVYQAKIVEVKKSPGKGLDAEYLNYEVDLKLIGNGVEGTALKTWASVRTFTKRMPDGTFVPVKGNPNQLAKLLRSAGLSSKPTTNSDYEAAVRQLSGKTVSVTLDWKAQNRDTGEIVDGFVNFPEDPERPGSRKSVLKRGDMYTERDRQGNITDTKVVSSEVLFANARIKYFQDAAPRVSR